MKILLYCHILLISPWLYAMEQSSLTHIKETELTIIKGFHELENIILTKLQDLRPDLRKFEQQVQSAQDIPQIEREKYDAQIALLNAFEKLILIQDFGMHNFEVTEEDIPSPVISCPSKPIAIPKRKSSSDLASMAKCAATENRAPLPVYSSDSYLTHKKNQHSRFLLIRPRSCPPDFNPLSYMPEQNFNDIDHYKISFN